MGLSIAVFKNIKAFAPEIHGKRFPNHANVLDASEVVEFTRENWPGRSDPLEPIRYLYSDIMTFRIGSCGSFNEEFRRPLCRMIGVDWDMEVPEGPFYEMLDFSDCEGIIGTIAVKKLALDFEKWSDRAKKLAAKSDTPAFFLKTYNVYWEACKGASQDGVIVYW